MSKRFHAQIATNKHEASAERVVDVGKCRRRSQSLLAPDWKNFQCPIRRMVCQAKALLGSPGGGLLGPHDLTVVGVDKDSGSLALAPGPIFVVENR